MKSAHLIIFPYTLNVSDAIGNKNPGAGDKECQTVSLVLRMSVALFPTMSAD